MKSRDQILFGLPIVIGCGVVLFGMLFYWQLRLFEASYMQDARRNIEQEAQLVEHIVRPLLDQGRLDDARSFCDSFSSDTLRLSLIDASGKVAADSDLKTTSEETDASPAALPVASPDDTELDDPGQ